MKYSVFTIVVGKEEKFFVTSENPKIWNSAYLTGDYDSDYLLEGMNYESSRLALLELEGDELMLRLFWEDDWEGSKPLISCKVQNLQTVESIEEVLEIYSSYKLMSELVK